MMIESGPDGQGRIIANRSVAATGILHTGIKGEVQYYGEFVALK